MRSEFHHTILELGLRAHIFGAAWKGMHEVVKRRRSIHYFTEEEVYDEEVNTLLEAAEWSPVVIVSVDRTKSKEKPRPRTPLKASSTTKPFRMMMGKKSFRCPLAFQQE